MRKASDVSTTDWWYQTHVKNTIFFHVCCYGSSKGWKSLYNTVVYMIYCAHFEITGGPCNLIGSHWCDLFTNHTNFCFKLHLFPSQWGGSAKHIITDQISKRVSCDKFCNFCFQNSYSPSPPKIDEFNFKLARYCASEKRWKQTQKKTAWVEKLFSSSFSLCCWT